MGGSGNTAGTEREREREREEGREGRERDVRYTSENKNSMLTKTVLCIFEQHIANSYILLRYISTLTDWSIIVCSVTGPIT